jgi:hypothetical protein
VFLLGRILERQLRDGLDVTTRNIDLHGADQHLRPTTARRHPCNYYIYIAVSTTVCAPSVAVPQPTVPRSPDLTHSPLLPTHFSMPPLSPLHSPSSTISSIDILQDKQPRSPSAIPRSTHHCSATPSTIETPVSQEETCAVVTTRAELSYHDPEDNDEPPPQLSRYDLLEDTGLVYDDQGNLRLSAVRVGLAAGLGETRPRGSSFTYAELASKFGLEMQSGECQSYPLAFPLEEDRVPLRDRGNPSRSSGQYSPDNTTIHQSEPENLGAPGLETEYMYDDEGGQESEKNDGSDGDDECCELGPDDRNPDPPPLHNDDARDQPGSHRAKQ